MITFGKWITKHKNVILFLAVLLLIPSIIGYIKTKINYDILSYLPDSLETIKGQDIMVDEFGMGAFSMIVVEDMSNQQTAALEKKIEKIDHVKDVLWYDDAMDLSVPTDMLPSDLKDALFQGKATMMIALFDDTSSADSTMEAMTSIRHVVGKQAFAAGITGVTTDIKNLCLKEMPIYVAIAALLSLVVLLLTMNSYVTPFLFLLTIGLSIIYNLGSNIFLGQISYLTQALTAVLQLAVTMDYSIFLLDSYSANKKRFEGDDKRAMAHAIANTFKSVSSSSITTIAGFLALCFMTFALGKDLGIVMCKGVVIGVIVCVTVLPALILTFDKLIEKTTHKPLIKNLNPVSHFIVKHRYIAILLFAIILVPALYGNSHYSIYYNLDQSLPSNLDSNIANKKLKDDFNMSNVHMVLCKDGMTAKEKNDMIRELKDVKGIRWVVGLNSFVGSNLPDFMIPDDVKDMVKNDHYELIFAASNYSSATDQCNSQISKMDKIVKQYQKGNMVIGEGPMMKDLQDVTDKDLTMVNTISMIAIFLIILVTFQSISIPIILVSIIEFAIALNMAIPYYTGISLPFVASIVIGTIQLGATVDYAILMTSRYQKERTIRKKSKKDAIRIAHEASIKSVLTSGLCFFAATFGVCLYSNIDMIGAICTLLARGAIISMIVVICCLPAFLWIFDGIITRTTYSLIKEKVWVRDKQIAAEDK